MFLRTQRTLVMLPALLVMGVLLAGQVTPALAAGEVLQVCSSSVTSEFPRGFSIKVRATGENEITSIAVRLRIGQKTWGAYDNFDLKRGRVVDGELFWRTDTASRYVPPGTLITYRFEVRDATGASLQTEPQQFIYRDTRFEWQETSVGPITIAYHGPVRSRAEKALQAMVDATEKMAPVLGPDTGEPISVTMYNNSREMLMALPPGSRTIRRELITAGQTSADFGIILMLGGNSGAEGTAAHEMTHILVHRAGDGVFRRVPLWLNEGLAEYANDGPAPQFDRALQYAVGRGRLLPSFLRSYPGTSRDTMVFYGQSRSIVRFMIDRYGADEMRRLMATLKSGKSPAKAIEQVYGFDMPTLDNMWRESVGAPVLLAPQRARSRPTPVPMRKMQPYSMTPQPNAEFVGNKSAAGTPDTSPAAEPVARPAATAVAEPLAVAAVASSDPAGETGPPAETEASRAVAPSSAATGCSAPRHGGPVPLELGLVGLLFGPAGLGLRFRLRRSRSEA